MPIERWAMESMHDTLATRETIRVFTLVTVYTRKCLALEVAPRFTRNDITRILSDAQARVGALPARFQCDNGTEFATSALDHWAYWNHVTFDFSRPGRPVDSSVCESFNGSLRRECLTQHRFTSVTEPRQSLTHGARTTTMHDPHSSLGHLKLSAFRRGGAYLPQHANAQY